MNNIIFRHFTAEDEPYILSMMKTFYTSDAVFTNGSHEIYKNDFDECIKDSPYLEGYTICDTNKIIGYAMIAKSFSTEFGKRCIWLEDLYLIKEYRGQGVIPKFINYIENLYPNYVLRIEAEKENEHALHVYKKQGFSVLPYMELKKEI